MDRLWIYGSDMSFDQLLGYGGRMETIAKALTDLRWETSDPDRS